MKIYFNSVLSEDNFNQKFIEINFWLKIDNNLHNLFKI